MDRTIPMPTRRAAKRAFVRTFSQAASAGLPTAGITGAVLSSADPAVIAWAVGAAGLTALIAASAAALDIIANGIPEDYAAAAAD